MKLGRYPLFAAAIAVVAALVPGSATAASSSKGPPAAPHNHVVPGVLRSLSCASHVTCFAITEAKHDTRFGVIRIVHKGASSHTKLLKTSITPVDLSCPSSKGCELLAQRAPTFAAVVLPVSSHGAIGKPMGVGAAPGLDLTNIACAPARTHCTVVGGNNQTVNVVTVTGATHSEHDLVLPSSVAGVGISGLACPTASQCFAVGAVSLHAKEHGIVVPIHNGVPGKPVYVSSASLNGMTAIACSSATTCYALGNAQLRNFIYTLHNAKVTHTSKDPRTLFLSGVACQSAHLCDAVGGKSGKGAVQPIHNGKLSKLQITKATAEYIPGGGEGIGPVAGFHGGIEIIGLSRVAGHSLISSS